MDVTRQFDTQTQGSSPPRGARNNGPGACRVVGGLSAWMELSACVILRSKLLNSPHASLAKSRWGLGRYEGAEEWLLSSAWPRGTQGRAYRNPYTGSS